MGTVWWRNNVIHAVCFEIEKPSASPSLSQVMDSTKIVFQIIYNKQTFITDCLLPLNLEQFYRNLRDVCKIPLMQPITTKWIDDDGDPCTISSEMELEEALRLYFEWKQSILCVHVFLGVPDNPGDLAPGENKSLYRRGANRRNKPFYHVNNHRFAHKRLTNLRTLCIVCNDYIWGIGYQGYRCVDCRVVVHKRCHRLTQQPCIANVSDAPSLCFINQMKISAAYERDYNFFCQDVTTAQHEVEVIYQEECNNKSPKTATFEDFNILTVIGRGSYAKVVQAEHKSTKKIYAIKIIKKELFNDEEDIDWIQTEKAVLETVSNHPFLVGQHFCFQTISRLFFVLDYIPGGDLMFHMQRERKLHENHARIYAAEIVLGLHFLHTKKIIYRDLKLDNVLIDGQGHIKLTDYGMCKQNIGSTDLTYTFCGTPNYIAPEILTGKGYGYSVDWWALGVLLYEMVAGRSPFTPANIEGVDDDKVEELLFENVLEMTPRIPRSISIRAAGILKAFLQKDPAQRLGCKEDLTESFMDIQNIAFFKHMIDWERLERKEYRAPYEPDFTDQRDLKYFDRQFTEEPPCLTPDDPDIVAQINQAEFDGFDYINPLMLSGEEEDEQNFSAKW